MGRDWSRYGYRFLDHRGGITVVECWCSLVFRSLDCFFHGLFNEIPYSCLEYDTSLIGGKKYLVQPIDCWVVCASPWLCWNFHMLIWGILILLFMRTCTGYRVDSYFCVIVSTTPSKISLHSNFRAYFIVISNVSLVINCHYMLFSSLNCSWEFSSFVAFIRKSLDALHSHNTFVVVKQHFLVIVYTWGMCINWNFDVYSFFTKIA